MAILDNDIFTVTFDELTGAVRSIYAKPIARILLENSSALPFVLERTQNDFTSEFDSFTYEIGKSDDSLNFTWVTGAYKVNSQIRLDYEGLHFSCTVENFGETPICAVEYPLLAGIGEFGEGEHNVVHSFATGIEIDNPLHNFKVENDGFRYMPYPESFSGASMQFFGYGMREAAGLYFAAYDNKGYQKWLNFYKHAGKLCASQIAGYEDIGAQKGVNAAWDFTVKFLPVTRWDIIADEYKSWALEQIWASEARNRNDTWLTDEMGAATFGINAMFDRTLWIKQYREDIKHPIFHILGPDWTNELQTFGRGVPGGYPDWVPTRFSMENIKCIKEQGDKFAPFEFDFLVATDKSESEQIKEALQVWPEKPKSVDKYTFTMLCPTEEYTRNLHVKRDFQVIKESDCDALYYDISANNILKTCMSEKHNHSVGGGSELTDAYKCIYNETREAVEKHAGKAVPIGTEMINETLIGGLNYYQARANAQPGSALETWPFRPLIRNNKARLLPLFKYVYGALSPLRLDGWGKLTKETGDLIYHTIAKTYLWGGLFEINSEYSEMERISGKSNLSEEHYSHFKPEGFAYDKNIADFIGKCASLRLGRQGEAMRKGEMIYAKEPLCRKIHRTYYQYNHGIHTGEQNDRGIIALDAILAQGYEYNGKQSLYIINTSLFEEETTISLPSQMENKELTIFRNDTATTMKSEGMLSLSLAPLEILTIRN